MIDSEFWIALVVFVLWLVLGLIFWSRAAALREARSKLEAQLDIADELEQIERGDADLDARIEQAVQDWKSKEEGTPE
jgi:hypothetical protein